MYSTPHIISKPISNNRLNFDERGNRTIVVPSLIEGTIDDVAIGNETVIEGEVGGKIVAGRGLKHFVFLKNARVPTWIMDNHNHAFAFWHEAYWKGWIQKGSLLVHIDQHTDLATPEALPMTNDEGRMTNAEIENYTNTVLTIADFIIPALATGLLSEALMVTGEDMQTARSYVWQMKNDEGKMTNEGSLIKKPSELITKNQQPTTIVDIDLDYFSQGFDDAKTLETTKYWIEKADIITIATSPLFIDQEKALSVLKSLQKYLVAL